MQCLPPSGRALHQVCTVNVVPGPVKDGDSHRCKAAGLCGIVQLIQCITQLHHVTTGTVTVSCDNIHAPKIFDEDCTPDAKHLNCNLVLATWRQTMHEREPTHPPQQEGSTQTSLARQCHTSSTTLPLIATTRRCPPNSCTRDISCHPMNAHRPLVPKM